MKDKKPTSIRLEDEQKKALQKIAKDEGRSLSNLIIKIITDYLKKQK